MKYLYSLFFQMLVICAYAQLQEDFSDGELLNNPTWQGDINHFTVNESYQLQLNREGNSGMSFLATPLTLPLANTEWSFYLRLAFSPSSNNNARVYLSTNHNDLLQATQALYLQFGESGSNDAIELFWQNDGNTISICRGTNAMIAQAFALNIKVKQFDNGTWQLLSHSPNETNYQIIAEGNASINLPPTPYFALQCNYTTSNAERFYFDDINIQTFSPDNTAPYLTYALCENAQQLRLIFSEAMAIESLQNLANYRIDGLGTPYEAMATEYQQQVLLSFSENWQIDNHYQLHINHLEDLSNNTMPDTTLSFSYLPLQARQLQINELMPDPYPPQNLPAEEYIELYNHSFQALWLKNWKLSVNDRDYPLPAYVIAPGNYLLLCHQEAVPLLLPYGQALGFSGFNLPNAAANVCLSDNYGNPIHTINYNIEWYQDSDKDDGGWSLAQINPNNECGEILNWRASANENGGSPGTQNTHWETEAVLPTLSEITINDHNSLSLHFNQQMQLSELVNTQNYSVNHGIGKPFQVVISDTASCVLLLFAEAMQQETLYTLRIEGVLRNCVGDTMAVPIETSFMLNKIADQGDIVINEIMADPTPTQGLPAHEYIELFNNSYSPILLKNWQLHINDKEIDISEHLMPPQSYLILCNNAAAPLLSAYGNTLSLNSFNLPNSEASISLQNADAIPIHYVAYQSAWQDEGKTGGGWSLEMKMADAYCIGRENWSSSLTPIGGSPGSVNSLQSSLNDISPLKINGLYVLDSLHIRLHFNRALHNFDLQNTSNYLVSPEIGMPTNAEIDAPANDAVLLSFESPLQKQMHYTVEVVGDMLDCMGNNAKGSQQSLALPEAIAKSDVVINELLFDALYAKGEYIELVNRSDKVLNLKDLSLSYIHSTNVDSTISTCNLQGGLIFPEQYVVFSAAPEQVKKGFYSEQPEHILEAGAFPSLSNQEGHLLLHLNSSRDSIIDQMHYSKDMHYALLQSSKGVALENINYNNPKAQWHSAASTAGFGTPTHQNSQFMTSEEPSKTMFQFNKSVFSPDNDGVEDILQINYKMPEAGYKLSAIIYNADGVVQKHLYDAELLGTKGELYWDGTTDTNEKAQMGIYIIVFEYFGLEGKSHREKKTIVVANRW